METEAFSSSKLGTQEHWDSVYAREVHNFDELGDEGEVWFGEEAVQRMVDFVEAEIEQGMLHDDPPEHGVLNVLDVGTGNGHLLFALLELDVTESVLQASNMLGIDYSPPSVELCQRIANAKGGEARNVKFSQLDFLCESETLQDRRWHLVCDKGTLDAIALSQTREQATGPKQHSPVMQYVANLASITQTGDLFLITSCNFTEQEVTDLFDEHFKVYRVVPVPSFSFGGQKGSTTVTIAFRRR